MRLGHTLQNRRLATLCADLAGLFFLLALLGIADHAIAEGPTAWKDWKVEIVAKVPQLNNPTAIACAPDGRVFIGEDNVDMAGPADQPVSRVVCLHPDGRITEFARDLYCVFGLLYVDGRLYVNHAPKFSVFKDNGEQGEQREDWFDYTSPRNGGILLTGARTHIPAGLWLGMDGFIYMAVGDIGIYGMTDRSGRRIDMHGGGVLRFRPDGTGAEIHSLGTRNHPQLAVNAEDEIFTYDNTDDGAGWWTRVTHMIDGGYYGYPWNYKPQRSHTLWMMTDYGPGAGSSALAYNEDALPVEYQGMIFFGDFARSEILALRLKPNGGSFAVDERIARSSQDFLRSSGDEFRPIAMAVSPDGRAFYITDWNSTAASVPISVGRLLRLTYTGTSSAEPRPDWFVPAGSGKAVTVPVQDLIKALRHPSQSVRLVSQRLLAKQGEPAVPALKSLLGDTTAPAFARWSAIWTLDSILKAEASTNGVIVACNDPDPSVRRQAARQLGIRSATNGWSALEKLSRDPDASVRLQALVALGRIGTSDSIPALQVALAEHDLFLRYSAFNSLRLIALKNPRVWPTVVSGLNSTNPAVVDGTLNTIRDTYSAELIQSIDRWFGSRDSQTEAQLKMIELLADLARQEPPWNGLWWGYDLGVHPATQPRPKRTSDWAGTPNVLAILRRALASPSSELRQAAGSHLGQLRDADSTAAFQSLYRQTTGSEQARWLELLLNSRTTNAAEEIVSILKRGPESLQSTALQAAATSDAPAVKAAVEEFLASSQGKAAPLIVAALAAIPRPGGPNHIAVLKRWINHSSAEVRAAAIEAISAAASPVAIAELGLLSQNAPIESARLAIQQLGRFRQDEAVQAITKASQRSELMDAGLSALAAHPTPLGLDLFLRGLQSPVPAQQQAALRGLAAIQNEVVDQLDDRDFSGQLPANFSQIWNAIRRSVPLDQFMVLGPFGRSIPDPSRIGQPDLGKVFRNDEGGSVSWRRVQGKRFSGKINLANQVDSRNALPQTMILLTGFNLPAAQRLRIEVQTPHPISVWLNGKALQATPDSTKSFDAEFPAGPTTMIIQQSRAESVRQFTASLRAPANSAETTSANADELLKFVRNNSGNIARGRELFSAETTGCAKCHMAEGRGIAIGPALDGVGVKYSRTKLAEAVLYPSKEILNGYQQVALTLRDGTAEQGLVRREDDKTITLANSNGQELTIARSDVAGRRTSTLSLMPEGLCQGLSDQQFADLITYLESLR